ncbi:MAG: efflux RND transporter periplasmic adaptor subunit [Bacteroidota bacterium]|nr:efflux RND transporter periplasmic adaptor subunit [Bacteroidota bacterium]
MKKIVLFALVVLTALACKRQADQGPDTGAQAHQHDALSSNYTLFSENLEFYVEHPALVAGVETEILVHLTRIDSYQACSEGNVGILMDGVSVTSGKADRPGIFKVPFTPGKGGSFHAEISYKEGKLRESVEAHVHVYADHDAMHAPVDDSNGHIHPPAQVGEITFLKEQAWQSDFRVERVNRGAFHTIISTSGELMPMPGEKKNIASTTRGMVRFMDLQLVQGAHVHQGQLLFTISSESLVEDNLKLRYEEAKNKLEKSRSQYKRHIQLYRSEAISKRQYQESRAIYTEDSLNFYNLESHISEEGIRIIAPASGSLHELAVSEGMYVTEGDILAILSPDRNLMLRVDLPQQYFQYSQSITTANFRPAYSEEVLSVTDLGGRLLAVGHSVKENDHYLPVNFMLKNDGSLLEGAFADVYLIAGERENVLSIPVTALGEEQGGKYVFIQVSGESYSKRRVLTGPGDGQRVEILSGLDEGERVVTRGTMLIKAASMETGEIAHGHSH